MHTDPRSDRRGAGVGRFRRLIAAVSVLLLVGVAAACTSSVEGTASADSAAVSSAPGELTTGSPVVPASPVIPSGSAAASSTVSPPRSMGPWTTEPSTELPAEPPSTEPVETKTEPGQTSSGAPAATSRSGPVNGPADDRATATVGGSGIQVQVGEPAIRIEIYAEPLCPPCADFEQNFGADITAAADDGSLAVEYRLLTFLDPRSASGTYSTRANGALICVADLGGTQPGLYSDFHAELFDPARQPTEGGDEDLTDDELAELAADVGAPPDVVACIEDRDRLDEAADLNDAALTALGRAGLAAETPMVTLDGKRIDIDNPDWLDEVLAG